MKDLRYWSPLLVGDPRSQRREYGTLTFTQTYRLFTFEFHQPTRLTKVDGRTLMLWVFDNPNAKVAP